MRTALLASAVYFTVSTAVAATEAVVTALYLPWRSIPLICGAAACFFAWIAAGEWTALRTRRHPDPEKQTHAHR